jgi:hypothetical protein
MRISTIAAIFSATLALAAPAAAGTYQSGPFPSEFGAGILPPDGDTFDNMNALNRAEAKLRTAVEKCYSKGVANFANGRATGVAACLGDPVRGALSKYAATVAVLVAKPGGLPPCAGLAQRGATIADLGRALHASAYCGDPVVIGSPGGAFVDRTMSF